VLWFSGKIMVKQSKGRGFDARSTRISLVVGKNSTLFFTQLTATYGKIGVTVFGCGLEVTPSNITAAQQNLVRAEEYHGADISRAHTNSLDIQTRKTRVGVLWEKTISAHLNRGGDLRNG
jgi:hypothetical protein